MSLVQSAFAYIFRITPQFKGKGRIVLLLDRLLGSSTAWPVQVVGTVNSLALMKFDLRAWGQKFAYYYGAWEKDYIALSRKLYEGGNFVDVGSSLGLYVVCLGDLVRKSGAAIISVEPLDFNLEKQRENVSLNRLEDVVHYRQISLGDCETKLRIASDPSKSDNNAFISSEGSVEVRMTTLDLLLASTNPSRVGFIKIDVEGYDVMVILGATETIRRDHPIIFAEFNRERMKINGFDMAPAWSFLVSEGYRAFEAKRGDLIEIENYGETENVFFLPGPTERRGHGIA